MSQLLGVLVVLAFVGLFATAIIMAIRRQKQRIAEKTQTLASHGYQVVQSPDPSFVERVTRLRTRWGHGQYKVRYCAIRKSWEYTAYVVDLWRRSGKNTRLVGENTMVFVSSRQQFPRFSLVPRPNLPGFVSGLVDTLAEKVLAQHGGQVEFPDDPSFAEKFIVAGKDHDAVRKLFTPQVKEFLTIHNRFELEVDADMVMVLPAELRRRASSTPQESLQMTISEGTALFELLVEK